MEGELIASIVAVIFIGMVITIPLIRRDRRNKALQKSLEDETIFVPGIGKVSHEELMAITAIEPEIVRSKSDDTEEEPTIEPVYLIENMPLSEERRKSLETSFLFLYNELGEDFLVSKKVWMPTFESFPFAINTLSDIIPVAHQIATIMDINPDDLEIVFFENTVPVYNYGVSNTNQENYAGQYWGKNKDGKYYITLADNAHHELNKLIAIIAHEFSHIKLLGEERILENNEELTDMMPLFYGLGIFSANASFNFNQFEKGYSYSKLGYLSQVDWGYLFALYINIRGEENPEWLKHLNPTVARDCERATEFILANPDLIFQD